MKLCVRVEGVIGTRKTPGSHFAQSGANAIKTLQGTANNITYIKVGVLHFRGVETMTLAGVAALHC
jgi:hypothetical protein